MNGPDPTGPPGPTTETEPDYSFHAFISYPWKTDYRAARQLEAFLESFHQSVPTAPAEVKPLLICRDGSDFTSQRRNPDAAPEGEGGGEDDDPVWKIIEDHLRHSRYLVVLCSPGAVKSYYVTREIRWFLKHRGARWILPVVTAGPDPQALPAAVFPPDLLAAGRHQSAIWYDLRGDGARWRTSGMRDADDERVRLAGDLLEWDGRAHGPLHPVWERERLRKRSRVALGLAVAAALFLVLGGYAMVIAQGQKKAVAREKAALAERDTALRQQAALVESEKRAVEKAQSEASKAREAADQRDTALAQKEAALDQRERAVTRERRALAERNRALERERAAVEQAAREAAEKLAAQEHARERSLAAQGRRLLMLSGVVREEAARNRQGWGELRQTSLLLSLEGTNRLQSVEDASLETYEYLRGAARSLPRSVVPLGRAGAPESLRFSRDGRFLLVAADDSARVLDAESGARTAAFAIAPDGRFVASDEFAVWAEISPRGALRVLRTRAGAEIAPLRRESGVRDAVVSDDGRYLAVADHAGRVTIQRTEDGEVLRVIPAAGEVEAMRFAPGGAAQGLGEARLAVVADTVLALWPADPARLPVTIGLGRRGFGALAFSGDGRRVAAATTRRWRVWDAATGAQVGGAEVFVPDSDGEVDDIIERVGLDGYGERLSVVSSEGYPSVWEVASESLVWPVVAPYDQFDTDEHFDFSNAEATVVARAIGGGIEAWELPAAREAVRVPFVGRPHAVAFSPALGKMAVLSDSGAVFLYDTRGADEQVAATVTGFVGQVETDAAGRRMALVTDREAGVWDLVSGRGLLSVPLEGRPGSASLSPDASVFAAFDGSRPRAWRLEGAAAGPAEVTLEGAEAPAAAGGVDMVAGDGYVAGRTDGTRELRVWRAGDGRLAFHRGPEAGVGAFALHPRGGLVAYADTGAGGGVGVWDLAAGREVARLPLPAATADSVEVRFSPGGGFLAAWTPARVAVWSVAEWTPWLDVRPERDAGASYLVFSPDDGHLAFWNGTKVYGDRNPDAAELWSLRTRTRLRALEHADRVSTVAFAAGGRMAASAGADSAIQIVDLERDTVLRVRHWSEVQSVGFSEDGTRMVVAGGQMARVWSLLPGRRPAEAAQIGHDDPVRRAFFRPGTSELVTLENAGRTTRLHVLAAGAEGLLTTLRAHLTRPELTPDERSRFIGEEEDAPPPAAARLAGTR